LRILVIEDDESDALLLVHALDRAGCAPLPVLGRADEAVRYLEGAGEYSARDRYPLPSLIVLDLGLPGMSGLEFLSWLRQQPVLSAIPVIVLSGSAYAHAVKQAYALGATTFFTKPLGKGLDSLAEAVVRYWKPSLSPGDEPKMGDSAGSPPQPSA
jgi:CheY-like chemotaxis protein